MFKLMIPQSSNGKYSVWGDSWKEGRYETLELAQEALEEYNKNHRNKNCAARHCGYHIRVLQNGKWVRIDE